mmetsp:Transcript_117493/g.312543  ORF Transcript_117493/g.312543 Transcript_117493/m.312543 type:complete len:225 (+) Transcript_117493:36-710(+)
MQPAEGGARRARPSSPAASAGPRAGAPAPLPPLALRSGDQLNSAEVRPVGVRGVVVLVLHRLSRRGRHDDDFGGLDHPLLLHRVEHAVGLQSLHNPDAEGANEDVSHFQLDGRKIFRRPLEHGRKGFQARGAYAAPGQAEVQVVHGQLQLLADLVLRLVGDIPLVCGRIVRVSGALRLLRARLLRLRLLPVAAEDAPDEDRHHGEHEERVEEDVEAHRSEGLLL